MTAGKPMGTIRGKSKVNGSRKPKGRVNKSNGPTWQAHRHGKKRSNRNGSPTGWTSRGFCQDNVQTHEGNKRRQYKPEPTLFTP